MTRAAAIPQEDLLERQTELSRIDGRLADARAGNGGVLLVGGPAGIGKTALLEETRRRASEAGMLVLAARGGELERDFAYGLVRQLFEPPLHRANAAARRTLLAGPAALAARVVAVPGGPEPAPEPPSGDQAAAALHGLYWLTSNLTTSRQVLIAVDDAHWSDAASLRFVLYLARRLEGLPVLLLLTARPGEPEGETTPLAEIAASPLSNTVEPAALSAEAVRELARRRLGGEPHERFVTGCHGATGGVPFFVHELLGSLAADGMAPSEATAAELDGLGPAGVRRATLMRLSRLPPAASRVAEAVAVLGRHASGTRVTALAGTTPQETLDAVDALASVKILTADDPLRFAHPILRASVYGEIPRARRSQEHARAAALLAAERADAEQVAGHLVATEPAGDERTAALLRDAAAAALERGAPESAVVYLERAVAEGAPPETRAALLHELGLAEVPLQDPRSIEHLHEALRLFDDPVGRARVARDLVPLLAWLGEWDACDEVTRAALTGLGDRDPELELELEATAAVRAVYTPDGGLDSGRLEHLRELASRGGSAARSLKLVLAAVGALRGAPADEVLRLAEEGLDGGRLIADEGAEAWQVAQGFGALVFCERLDDAERVAEQMQDNARSRGSVLGFMFAASHRAWVEERRGNLAACEADLRTVLDLSVLYQHAFMVPTLLWYCGEAIVERPQLADVVTLLESIRLAPAVDGTMSGAWTRELRARARVAAGGEPDVEELRVAAGIFRGAQVDNPNVGPWRSHLARVIAPTDPDEASRLVAEELELARRLRMPRAEGIALRAAGLLEGGEAGIALLRESLERLGHAPSALERARTLVELGSALRRGNQRSAARDSLSEGLDLAHRCGAERLADHAMAEFRASGAKPRRRPHSGIEALTPSEERVAHMAASGLSNREIAQTLFVTAKTVENQLGRVYSKLSVAGRAELAQALAQPES